MTSFHLILASLRHYRRIHVTVALGVAVATAVLTGALLVGDSVRGSLRDLTLERLGLIGEVLVSPHLFRAELADELAAGADFGPQFTAAEPALLMPGTLQSGSGDARRANDVSIVGCRPGFWKLGQGGPLDDLAADQIAITAPLADELGAAAGDTLLLRIGTAGAVPADSPLGEKSDTSVARRLVVAQVLEDKGLARFALRPSQQLPRSAFVPLATLQSLLDQAGRANAILVAGRDADSAPDDAARDRLQAALRPQLTDYGLTVDVLTSPTAAVQIASDQLVLPDEVVAAAGRAFGDDQLQPVVTYLANTLVVGQGDTQRKIPYSTISGVDSTAALGPLLDQDGRPIALADDEIVLNRWAADDLGAQIGDTVSVNFYEPESTHGRLHEHQPPARFRLTHIVELTDDGSPTRAADPRLTPELPGVTDQRSISDWDLPFELTETIRPQDEDYWDQYRTTPKAFVSLAAANELWASRWGTISLLRLPTTGDAAGPSAAAVGESIAARLLAQLDPASLGMSFLPVKRQGLAAAAGTTPFDALFLGFSFFLIAAAVMLIAILFQLGVQQRAGELGILAAVGLRSRQIVRLLAREGLAVALIGSAVGVVAGVCYAWLMIAGLRTLWVAAVAAPFLELHVTPRSLAIGYAVGVLVSWLTIRWSIRRLARLPVGRLLAGQTEAPLTQMAPSTGAPRTPRRLLRWPLVRITLAVMAVALGIAGLNLRGEAQAGSFFGSGAALVVLLLGEVRVRLGASRRTRPAPRNFNLASLALLNMRRNPGRSTMTIGLVAAASFLIVAISAFRLQTTDEGTGGFRLVATSDRPIHYDLNTPEGRVELGFSNDDSQQLDDGHVYALRLRDGEDASCLNLYRPTQPQVLGVPARLIERGGFAWADHAETASDNPWTLLDADLGSDGAGRPVVPVVLDMNTAVYSLHLGGVGARLTVSDGQQRPVTLEVVGLLKNSLLQGSLLMSEQNFLRLYPDVGGYRFFLIEPKDGPAKRRSPAMEGSATGDSAAMAQLLEQTLAADGFDAQDGVARLAGFFAVQNTYLSTFQSLGALGMLLGTIGLAVVQLRSVLERRGELALLRSSGFSRRRLLAMVVCENALLLLGGLAVGVVAAAVALVPHWLPQGASVPWATLAVLMLVIAAVGLAAGWLATRSALRAPLVPALRGD